MRTVLLFACLLHLLTGCGNKQPKDNVDGETKYEFEATSVPEEKERSVAELKKKLKADGYQVFDYVDQASGDTVLMQQYFMAFLKSGPTRSQDSLEAARLQQAHLTHLKRMYDLGYADISGPFGDDGALRGITIYNVPTLEMADSLANLDPMVKAGRLVIEVKPWWAAKGYPLR